MRKTKPPTTVSEAAAETSKELVEEVGKNEKPPTVFDSAHAAKESPLSPEFERITERIFIVDPHATYERLEKALRVGEDRSEHATLMRALDEAETNARQAHRLYVTAKVERERWELDNDVVFGAMRTEATRSLQHEKDQGLRSKQITDADVSNACASIFPDQWRHQELKRRKVKSMEDSLSNLAELWQSRCRSLQAMLGKLR